MMAGLLYLGSLLAGIGCMLLIDWRFRLFFWHNPAAAGLVTAAGTGFLLLGDAAGIASGAAAVGCGTVAGWLISAPRPRPRPGLWCRWGADGAAGRAGAAVLSAFFGAGFFEVLMDRSPDG